MQAPLPRKLARERGSACCRPRLCWNSRVHVRAHRDRSVERPARCACDAAGCEGKPGERSDVHEMHRHGGRHGLRRGTHELCERIFSLLAVDEAHGLAEFFGSEVLEALEVLDGASVVILAAEGLREAEFGGDLERIQFQRVLESGDGFVVVLLLGINAGRGNIACRRRRDRAPRLSGNLRWRRRAAGGFCEQAEVVPDARIFRIALGGFLENLLGFVEALHVEEARCRR